jgi:peptidoglycan/xylan/chitin deacetylase (PgdA/CDA1 family)
MRTIYYTYPQGKTKALTFSYDDGKVADYKLVALFNQYKVKGTFHLNSGLKTSDRIPAGEYRDVYAGHEISCHTCTHPTISRENISQVAMEILQDRIQLEKITGKPVMGLSYPNGSTSREIETLLPGVGIKYARTVHSTHSFELPENWFMLNPTCHHNENIMELADAFINFQKRQYLKLFYLWGHSYEFDRDNNWDIIEKFLQRVKGRDDIWYATNIEICDYIRAAKMLEFTVEGTYVCNPSAVDIFLEVDGEITVVKGGQGLPL